MVEWVIRQINERIPVPYLTNKAWFCGLEFYVDDCVLIPRSPIGELITDRFRDLLPHPPAHLLDIYTSSDCIAIAYAYPEVDAVDIASGVEHQVTPIRSDLFRDLLLLAYDVNDFPAEFHAEPVLGLAVGSDSLKLVRRIMACEPDYLAENGVLICEMGNSMVHLMAQYPAGAVPLAGVRPRWRRCIHVDAVTVDRLRRTFQAVP